jgi:aryl-alcohol dehydrogenase-like predicted oxidoreductase
MDIRLSKIGLGCVTFGREIDESQSFAIMDYAAEHDICFFDTAEAYGEGASEKIIGNWLRSRGMAGKIAVVTKISQKLTTDNIREALSRSQERLGLDMIDGYLLHFFDETTPLEDSLEGLAIAVESRSIRVAGCSNFNAEQLNRALDLSEQKGLIRLGMVQPIYNLTARAIDQDLLKDATERGVAVITYSPLGAGFLSGKYSANREMIPKGSRFDVRPGHVDIYFKPENFRLVEKLRTKSEATGLSMSRLAMGWVLSNPMVSSVLVGARSVEQVSAAVETLSAPLPLDLKAEMDEWTS